MPKIFVNLIKETSDLEIIANYLHDLQGFIRCLFCQEDNLTGHLALCKDCGYYFCNNLCKKKSHLLHHLSQCKHKKIELHTGELKCEDCGENDVFKLKYLKKNEITSILCNDCSDGKKNYKSIIIEKKKIDPTILQIRDIPPLANRDDDYLEIYINKLNSKIKALINNSLIPVSMSYSDKKKFSSLQINFLNHEIETIEDENENGVSYAFNLKIVEDDYGFLAEVNGLENENINFRFNEGQELIIEKAKKISDNSFNFSDEEISSTSDNDFSLIKEIKEFGNDEEIEEFEYIGNDKKSFTGKVIGRSKDNRIIIACLDLKKNYGDGIYLIKEKNTTGSEKKMITGLNLFGKYKKMDNDIESIILGNPNFSIENTYFSVKDIPEKFCIKELPDTKLNDSQREFIKKCYIYKFNLLQGPPGSGKSTVLAVLTYFFSKSKKQNHKILICAPSNQAVDNISALLQKLNLKFVRVFSFARELRNENDKTNSLLDLAKKEIYKDKDKNKEIIRLLEKREKYKSLSYSEENTYQKLMGDIEAKIIDENDIVISTINNSSDKRLESYFFSLVIIDEATQAKEADSILPLIHNAEVVVLIGDQKQLGPTVISQEAAAAGYYISQFERLTNLYKGSDFISTLNEQYRTHEFLYRFPNEYFYENKMITRSNNQLDENVMLKLPFPNKQIPTFFYHHTEEEKEENGSFYNENEINKVKSFTKMLLNSGVSTEEIGVITLYNAQKFRLMEIFKKDKTLEKIKISSVDGFQGMEKKYIIISTVRSNIHGVIGFSKNEKRLNVALTRGQKGVILIGNCACFSKRPSIWRKLISFYYHNKLIIKGPLSDLELVKKEEILLKVDDIEDDENEIYESLKEMIYNKNPAPLIVDYKNNESKKKENKKNENKINIIREEEIKNEKKKENNNKIFKNEIKEEVPKAKKKKKSDKKYIPEKKINKDDKRKVVKVRKTLKEKKEKEKEDKNKEDEKEEDEKEEDEKVEEEENKEKHNKKGKNKNQSLLSKKEQRKENNKKNNKKDDNKNEKEKEKGNNKNKKKGKK